MKKNFGKIAVLLLLSVVMINSLAAGGQQEKTSAEAKTVMEVPERNTLKIGIRASINSLGYPGKLQTTSEFLVVAPALETLGRFGEGGVVVPFLLDSFSDDADSKTITFNLRPNVKFHDGTVFDAAALKWNLEDTISAKGKKFSTPISFEVVDPLKVVLHMDNWDNSIRDYLLVNYGYMVSPTYVQKVGKDVANANPVGTGPYKLSNWERDAVVQYTKFDGYWGGTPKLDGIDIYTFADASSTTSAMRTGEIDAIMQTDPESTVAMREDGVPQVSRSLSTGTVISGFILTSNNPDLPTYDVNVRKALSHAIDVETICASFAKGGSYAYTNQWASPGSWSYNNDVVGYKYDPAKAKAMLKAAGYEDGFTLEAFASANSSMWMQALAYAQSYLAEVNVKLNITGTEQSLSNTLSLKTGWDGFTIFSVNGNSDCADPVLAAFGDNGTRWSPDTYHPTEIPPLVEKALGAKNFEDKKKATQALNKVLIDDYCLIQPFFSRSSDFYANAYVKDSGFGQYHAVLWTPELVRIGK